MARPTGGSQKGLTNLITALKPIPFSNGSTMKGNMTREFNKRQRNDGQPPFRHQSPEHYGEERSPRPARPRLSREVVDRAWEMGAQYQHADYRPRNNGQSSYQNRHTNQSTGHTSPQHGPNRSNTYRDRQNQYQGNNRRNESAPSDQRGPSNTHAQSFHPNRRPSGRFAQGNRPPRFENNRPERSARSEWNQENRRDNRNRFPPQRENTNYAPQEQFEGDYEYFSMDNTGSSPRPRRSFKPSPQGERTPERHVTRLPDGRVLKGSRPVQRQQARFWKDIHNETENLMGPDAQPPTTQQESPSKPEKRRTAPARKPTNPASRTHSTDEHLHGKKREGVDKKPRSAGPRPSQRGFKWPSS